MRSGKRIAFDLLFLSIHIGKWVLGIYLAVNIYFTIPAVFWFFVFLGLGQYISLDLYRCFKAIIKDTSTDNLDSEGEFSYVKGIDPKDLTAAKTQVLLYLAIFTIGIVGITNNVHQWREDGQNRLGNIAISSLFAAAPIIVLVGETRKRN